jgi:hypothetical protein
LTNSGLVSVSVSAAIMLEAPRPAHHEIEVFFCTPEARMTNHQMVVAGGTEGRFAGALPPG